MANGYGNPNFGPGFGGPMYGPGFTPGNGGYWGAPGFTPYWWGAPAGWTDLDLYDYNNNFILDDEEIADIVRDNIQANPFIPPSDVNSIAIDVKKGVVTLSGKVRNPRSKPLAYADAFWSTGVADVISNVEVAPPERKTGQKMKGK